MKLLNFKKVSTSVNDATDEYFIPSDKILGMQTTDGDIIKVYLRAVAGTANDEVGDNITITCETGKAYEVGDDIASLMYSNFSKGASPVIDASFSNSNIKGILLTAV
tara:strand:+ start:17 stop:337 length:321 start_codon:yes stop_codon:yes gene_type:complete